MKQKKPPFWKAALPDSHFHRVLLLAVVILILYLLLRAAN